VDYESGALPLWIASLHQLNQEARYRKLQPMADLCDRLKLRDPAPDQPLTQPFVVNPGCTDKQILISFGKIYDATL
jgi:hypothetical protein